MIDLKRATDAFENYISQYDLSIPSLRLKVIHTYETMKCIRMLCDQLTLTHEEKDLATLIALLHDIGRFEQWVRYESFADYKTIDHALFSSELLFDKGLIRNFIQDEHYDNIIKAAIVCHNQYKLVDEYDEKTLLFIHLMRDADKLDNFRVKEEESIETLLFVSLDEVNNEKISPLVYDQFYHQELIYAPNRQTHLDMWLSYIAFLFDLHFDESIQYIRENHWIERSFARITPIDETTKKEYDILKQRALEYVK